MKFDCSLAIPRMKIADSIIHRVRLAWHGHQSRRKQHIPWRRRPTKRKGFPTAPLSANYKVKPMFAAGVVADDEPTRRAAVPSAKERELAGRREGRRGGISRLGLASKFLGFSYLLFNRDFVSSRSLRGGQCTSIKCNQRRAGKSASIVETWCMASKT